jgi:hypothetical protein
MDWTIVLVCAGAVFIAVVLYMLFMSGETVGFVSGIVSSEFMSDQTARLVVKRIAPSKSRRHPSVMLQFRLFVATSGGHLNAAEAKRMANTIDQMIDGKNPTGVQFRGFSLERLPGEIGVTTDIGVDARNVKTAALDYADAHELADLLRIAASPGDDVEQARSNWEKEGVPP